MASKRIAISLHGACVVRSLAPAGFEITGAKHRALFALLATAPLGRRTRAFVQETLWGATDYEVGRQNLRRAIADIKRIMGPVFAEVIDASATDLVLRLEAVELLGRPGQGVFLEGMDVRTPAFLRWLEEMRRAPAQPVAATALAEPGPGAARAPQPPAETLPTVAVIPFRAVDDAPEHAVLGDWLAEETSRALSRSHLMAIIAHLSARQLGGARLDIAHITTRLGAAYCVAGTLRRAGGQIVVDADFIDCASGRLLWTRQCLLPAQHPFEAGLEAVQGLVEAVGRALTEESVAAVAGRALKDIEDHRLVVAGVGLMHRPALRDFARARMLLEEAALRAPNCAEIHAWLGKWHVLSVFNHWSADVAADTQRSLDCTARALDLSPTSSFCLTMDGFAQNNLMKRMDTASQRYQLALQHNPSEALSWLLKGALLAFQDDGQGAIQAAARARRLSPIDPFGYFYDTLSASAHIAAEDYEQALLFVDRSIAANDRHLSSLRSRITALHHLGRGDEARATARMLLQKQPGFTVEGYLRSHPAGEFSIGRRVADALLAAGIP
jgi:TolB-like protein